MRGAIDGVPSALHVTRKTIRGAGVLGMETADITKNNNDSGIQSLSGFAYQIRVFVYYMSKMTSKMQIEFETLEDVVVKNPNANILDQNSIEFRSLLKQENGYDVIQVKRTSIDNDSRQKILYNWMLLEEKNINVSSYILFTDDSYKNPDIIFEITPDELFLIVTESKKKANSLVSKVKSTYGTDFDKFKIAYKKVKDNYSFISETNLDANIMNGFAIIFRREGVSDLIYALRIKELIQTITYEILSAIDKKSSYICTYKIMMQKAEDICDRIKDNYYEPDYTIFRKTNSINLADQIVANSREYKQLFSCNLSAKRIEEHLIYHQYYRSIRYRYLEDNKLNFVDNIEKTTYDNFCDVKEYLTENNTDTPYNRLDCTKNKQNYYAPKNQTRYGSCIHLTTDSIDNNSKISWEDENE